ncbi:MAG: DNA polymerase I [Rhodothermales bacterium]
MIETQQIDASNTGGRKRLYLIDAMALAYRSHFIFISRPLINSKGQNTSASYGFTNALLKLIEDHAMDHIVVVFDVGGDRETFRSEMYEDYKAHREPPPDDLLANLPWIKDIIQALDIPVVEVPYVEADDVIGTLARRAEADDADVVIVSPDKDFQQLLTDRISIFRPAHRGEDFDPITAMSFLEKYGVEPIRFIDMLALMGDSSDNVPGVPGIGPKTAAKLIAQYDTVENLLDHAGEVKGKKAREGLLNYRDDALLSKKLVTIKTDVDEVEVDWERFRRLAPDRRKLLALFRELEFRTLARRLEQSGEVFKSKAREQEAAGVQVDLFADDPALDFDFGPYEEVAQYDPDDVAYRIIRNRDQLAELAEALAAQDRFALDTETTSVDQMIASLVGVSFSWAEKQGCYVPTPLPDGTTTEEVLSVLRPLLQDKKIVGQNLKYDLVVLARHGVQVQGPLFDTMVAHYLIAPEGEHNLDSLARHYLSYRTIPIAELIGTGKNQRSMRDVPIDEVGPYACEDADITFRLADPLRLELEKSGLVEIAESMEFPLIYVLSEMEQTGVRIDATVLREISGHLAVELKRLEHEIYAVAGEEFNIGSTQQLGKILFEKLGLRVVSKTSTGKASTRESVLQELATEHPLPGLLLDWRKLSKLKNTYVDTLGDLAHPETRRVHTDFNQTITATGRLSSSNPNLQNIPVRTEIGREIRKAFVPREGWKLLSADYVQIELRILASMSGDKALTQDFIDGKDIHSATAARVFHIAPDEVTRDQRRKAKEVNYGIPYGVSAWGLAQRLRCSVQEAQELIDQYQRTYPDISRYLVDKVEEAREHGYVETLLGRRRYLPAINARNRNERSFAERAAVNMPIQGTQADMIKLAMVRIHERMKKEGVQSRMLLQVHDELVFEVPPEEEQALRALIEEEMVHALPLNVPIEVDINTGDNWLDAH